MSYWAPKQKIITCWYLSLFISGHFEKHTALSLLVKLQVSVTVITNVYKDEIVLRIQSVYELHGVMNGYRR